MVKDKTKGEEELQVEPRRHSTNSTPELSLILKSKMARLGPGDQAEAEVLYGEVPPRGPIFLYGVPFSQKGYPFRILCIELLISKPLK